MTWNSISLWLPGQWKSHIPRAVRVELVPNIRVIPRLKTLQKMTDETEHFQMALGAALREMQQKSRRYADFFSSGGDRSWEELYAVMRLEVCLKKSGMHEFAHPKSRGRDNDPPDCEAVDSQGKRIAIEVTELVDPSAIKTARKEKTPFYEWAEWPSEKFHSRAIDLIKSKDEKFLNFQEPPYEGGYLLLIMTDEPELRNADTVQQYLCTWKPPKVNHIDRVFLLLSYDPKTDGYPHYELSVDKSK